MTSLTPDASISLKPKGGLRYRPATHFAGSNLSSSTAGCRSRVRGIVLRTTLIGFYATRRGERPRNLVVR
jgi:hypothetical protein